jgi:hypothetical protein
MQLLTVTAIVLTAAELLARLAFPDMTYGNLVLRLTNERPKWATPDAEFHHVGDGIYRLEFPSITEPERNRVMIVGDSFPMGHGVGEDKRFGHLLQTYYGDSVKVDVLASTSYSPVIYRRIIEKALSLARYRAIAVYIDQTDPVDELIYKEDVIEQQGRTFDLERMTERKQAINAAYDDLLSGMSNLMSPRHVTIYNLLRPPSLLDNLNQGAKFYHYLKLSLGRMDLIREFSINQNSDQSEEMKALMVRHLDQIVSLCGRNQVPLLLLTNPWEFQTSSRPRITLQLPGPFPKENRPELILQSRYSDIPAVHVVPMTRAFREQPNPSSLYLDHPGHEFHWNEAGHALAEQVLRDQLSIILPDLKPDR